MKTSAITLLSGLLLLAGVQAHAFTVEPTLSCQSGDSGAPELSLKCLISDEGVGTVVQCSANGYELHQTRANNTFVGSLENEAILIVLNNIEKVDELSAKAKIGDFRYYCR